MRWLATVVISVVSETPRTAPKRMLWVFGSDKAPIARFPVTRIQQCFFFAIISLHRYEKQKMGRREQSLRFNLLVYVYKLVQGVFQSRSLHLSSFFFFLDMCRRISGAALQRSARYTIEEVRYTQRLPPLLRNSLEGKFTAETSKCMPERVEARK